MSPPSFPYWKSVGGYLSAVKVRGRWYYIGNLHAEIREAREALGPFRRVQGMPKALGRLWSKHGSTTAALKDHLPHWKEIKL